jgi:hypothetical protein
MLEEYAWTLWFLIPLSIPVMGVLYLAACALSDRETSFVGAMVFGSLTFFASFPLGWWLVWLLAHQDPNPQARFGTMHTVGVGLAVLLSWLIGSAVYSAAFKGRVPKAVQVAGIEALLRLLLGALVGGVAAVVVAIMQVARDPAYRDLLLPASLIFGGILAAILTLVIVTGILRRRAAVR